VKQRVAVLNEALLNKAKVDVGRQEVLEILGMAEEELRRLAGPIGHGLEDAHTVLQATQVGLHLYLYS